MFLYHTISQRALWDAPFPFNSYQSSSSMVSKCLLFCLHVLHVNFSWCLRFLVFLLLRFLSLAGLREFVVKELADY